MPKFRDTIFLAQASRLINAEEFAINSTNHSSQKSGFTLHQLRVLRPRQDDR